MRTLFAVTRIKGKAWDATQPMRSQHQWNEHAAFMERLAADGFVILGGPLDDGNEVLLVIDAARESEVVSTLAQDPWSPTSILEIKSIRPWNILLESGAR